MHPTFLKYILIKSNCTWKRKDKNGCKKMTSSFSSLKKRLVGLWGMARPLVLVSNILAWLLGVSIAFGTGEPMEVTSLGLGFFVMMLVSVSIHYANEYSDYQTDALTTRTLYSGGSGVLPSGNVPRKLALQAASTTLILAVGVEVGTVLLRIHSWWSMILLMIGALGGWMYSLPPLKLAWRGWGEVDNALLGANLLPTYGYITLSGDLNFWVFLACLPFTLLAFNNLLAITWPDRAADVQAGKRTLATQWSSLRLQKLYGIVAIICFMLLLVLRDWILPSEIVIVSFIALPLTIRGMVTYTHNTISRVSVYAMIIMGQMQTLMWFTIGISK
jgi:1,4-dihydroxy-2-naphthoate octaprenyltransferase